MNDKQTDVRAFLYPYFNTRRIDNPETFDGRPYEEGVNLLGPKTPQYYWDIDNDSNYLNPAYDIEPGGRVVISKQEQFYNAIFNKTPEGERIHPAESGDILEVFMSGARGTAKTVALVKSHGLKRIVWKAKGITGVNSAMFARTKDDLEKRHIAELPNLIPSWMGEYDASRMTFHFSEKYCGGGVLFFLYAGLRDEQIKRILSQNLAYITFEELTELTEYQYQYVKGAARSNKVPRDEWCIAAASNAGGRGHKWVARHWVNPRLRKEANKKDGARRIHIACLPYENPTLPRKYWDDQMRNLPPKLKASFRDNDWSIYEGQFFDMIDDEVHFMPNRKTRDEVPKYGSIDHGSGGTGGHPTGALLSEFYKPTEEHPLGKRIVVKYYESKENFTGRNKQNILKLIAGVKNIQYPFIMSHDAFYNRGTNISVAKIYSEENQFGKAIECVPGDKRPGARAIGWKLLKDLLSYEYHIETGAEGVLEMIIDRPPHLYFLDTPEIRKGVEELKSMVHDDNDPDDAIRVGSKTYELYEGDEFPDALRQLMVAVDSDGELILDLTPEERPWNPDEFYERRDRLVVTMADF